MENNILAKINTTENGCDISLKMIDDEYIPVDQQKLSDIINYILAKNNIERYKEIEQEHKTKQINNNIKQKAQIPPIENLTHIDSNKLPEETIEKFKDNKKNIICYRQTDLASLPETGAFFSFYVNEKFKIPFKIEVTSEELYEISEIELKNYNNPLLYLIDRWFSVEQIRKAKQQYKHLSINQLAAKLIKDKCCSFNYSAIQYGNKFIQVCKY